MTNANLPPLTASVYAFVERRPGATSRDIGHALGRSAASLVATMAVRGILERRRTGLPVGPDGAALVWQYWVPKAMP